METQLFLLGTLTVGGDMEVALDLFVYINRPFFIQININHFHLMIWIYVIIVFHDNAVCCYFTKTMP